LHAGVGQAAELIDLPIARLKGTGIPYVPGSSIKGVLRDARSGAGFNSDEVQAVFGPDKDNADKHAGALICTDARLLALPVRSFRGTFAYVTSRREGPADAAVSS
jgi:CRISPR-associated protein Cmr4